METVDQFHRETHCIEPAGFKVMARRIKLSDLIEAGIIRLPFPIHVRFKGKDFKAEIDKDGFVLLAGKRHTSLSIAGGIIRAAVSGKPADGLRYRRVNGWTFWKFKDADGKKKPVDTLRERYIDTSSRHRKKNP